MSYIIKKSKEHFSHLHDLYYIGKRDWAFGKREDFWSADKSEAVQYKTSLEAENQAIKMSGHNHKFTIESFGFD